MSATLPSAALLSLDKVQARHRDRCAVVYVRQSTVRQVQRHQESTRLQYALADRARRLGWHPEQVVVIDDDLGRSAISALDRPGFQRLVAEVGLGHVGLVLGIEVSRLARSCRDWHQLLEMCALFDTLIADADGLYDPSTYNDRLLLGLKGTMSEAELHILKARMHEGRRAKAVRGELVIGLPRGYVQRPSGEVALDPDEQVRSTIRLVFDVFERRRSIRGLLTYLVHHDIQLPDRERSGARKGEVRWNRPNQATLGDMLRHPAYIDWANYAGNQKQMAANRAKHDGVPRGGPALLGGRVRCGLCGRRMALAYHDNGREARYQCCQEAVTFGGLRCQSLSAQPVDRLVAGLILAALAPSAVEVSLQLAEDVPALWHATTTTQKDRQAIARLMLDQVDVRVDGNSEHVEVACNWAGGVRTRHALVRPVRRFEQLRGFDQLLATIRDLRGQGCSAADVAEQLNGAGWRPPKRDAVRPIHDPAPGVPLRAVAGAADLEQQRPARARHRVDLARGSQAARRAPAHSVSLAA